MSWRVIKEFADKTDGFYVYKAGDLFPRDGKLVDDQRIAALESGNNAIGVPLIERIVVEKKAPEPQRKRSTKNKVKE